MPLLHYSMLDEMLAMSVVVLLGKLGVSLVFKGFATPMAQAIMGFGRFEKKRKYLGNSRSRSRALDEVFCAQCLWTVGNDAVTAGWRKGTRDYYIGGYGKIFALDVVFNLPGNLIYALEFLITQLQL
jgi:hypothetical protein